MSRIYKYPLVELGEITLSLPKAAKILCVQTKNDLPNLWVMVDPEETEMYQRKFFVVGTGHDFPGQFNVIYIGTCQIGPFVWHVFEDTR